MIKEAIDKILSLGASRIEAQNGRYFVNGPGGIHAIPTPKAAVLEINTMTGIVDYLPGDSLMIHIVGPTKINVVDQFLGGDGWLTRNTYLSAVHESPTFNFGRWMDVESFIINLQAMFVPDETTALILKVVGNIKEEAVASFTDDGITQAVTAKAGISRVEQVAVPNPVTLRPYRTFMEIEQPASTFVLRMRGGKGESPSCALFEADGRMWQLEAIASIKAWLKSEIPGIKIIA